MRFIDSWLLRSFGFILLLWFFGSVTAFGFLSFWSFDLGYPVFGIDHIDYHCTETVLSKEILSQRLILQFYIIKDFIYQPTGIPFPHYCPFPSLPSLPQLLQILTLPRISYCVVIPTPIPTYTLYFYP